MTRTQDVAAHSTKIPSDTLDQLFRQARTHSAWLPRRVPVEVLREVYELARWGQPARNALLRVLYFSKAQLRRRTWCPLSLRAMSKKQKPRRSPSLSPGTRSSTKGCPSYFPRRTCVLILWGNRR